MWSFFFSAACLSIIIMVQVDITAGIGPFRYHHEYVFPLWPAMVINVDVKLGPLGPSLTATAVYGSWQANLELGVKHTDNVQGVPLGEGMEALLGEGMGPTLPEGMELPPGTGCCDLACTVGTLS